MIINAIQYINEVMHDALSDIDIHNIRDLNMKELPRDKMVNNNTEDENNNNNLYIDVKFKIMMQIHNISKKFQ